MSRFDRTAWQACSTANALHETGRLTVPRPTFDKVIVRRFRSGLGGDPAALIFPVYGQVLGDVAGAEIGGHIVLQDPVDELRREEGEVQHHADVARSCFA